VQAPDASLSLSSSRKSVGGFYHKQPEPAVEKSQISLAIPCAPWAKCGRNSALLTRFQRNWRLGYNHQKQERKGIAMLYIFESAFDEVEAVSREAREKLSGLEQVLQTTSESLKVLQERLEQTAG
jgi:hypothetical protein